MPSYNVLVTGGAGFIGSHLVDALLASGHRVRVLDCLVPQVHGSQPLDLNRDAEFIKGDLRDPDMLVRALHGTDVIYHEAAEVGVGQSMYEMERYVSGNTLATSLLLQAVVKVRDRIRKLVVASSMSIYGEGAYSCDSCGPAFPQIRPSTQLALRRWEAECPGCKSSMRPVPTSEEKPLFPTSVYAITKQDQEQLCLVVGRAYGVPTVALRYFNVYGPRQALSNPYTGVCAIFSSRLLNNERPVIFEDGKQTRDFVHVSDIVQANMLALETDRADYLPVNVGTGRPTSVMAAAQLLAAGLGKDLPPEIVARYREGDIRHCIADISRANELLGYSPRVSLEKGIPELLEWVRSQTATDRVAHATQELEAHALVR